VVIGGWEDMVEESPHDRESKTIRRQLIKSFPIVKKADGTKLELMTR